MVDGRHISWKIIYFSIILGYIVEDLVEDSCHLLSILGGVLLDQINPEHEIIFAL